MASKVLPVPARSIHSLAHNIPILNSKYINKKLLKHLSPPPPLPPKISL